MVLYRQIPFTLAIAVIAEAILMHISAEQVPSLQRAAIRYLKLANSSVFWPVMLISVQSFGPTVQLQHRHSAQFAVQLHKISLLSWTPTNRSSTTWSKETKYDCRIVVLTINHMNGFTIYNEALRYWSSQYPVSKGKWGRLQSCGTYRHTARLSCPGKMEGQDQAPPA